MRRAVFALAVAFAMPAFGQPNTPAPAPGQQVPARFHVVNAGREPIVAVSASPVTDTSWGPNLIGRVYIPPGSSLAITPRERNTCLFDLRISWADGRHEERRRENFCGASRTYRVDGSTAQR